MKLNQQQKEFLRDASILIIVFLPFLISIFWKPFGIYYLLFIMIIGIIIKFIQLGKKEKREENENKK